MCPADAELMHFKLNSHALSTVMHKILHFCSSISRIHIEVWLTNGVLTEDQSVIFNSSTLFLNFAKGFDGYELG